MDVDLNIKPKNVGTILLYSLGFFSIAAKRID